MRDNSYSLTKEQYNYLLPVFGICAAIRTQLLTRRDKYYFIGTYDEYLDALNRCKYL